MDKKIILALSLLFMLGGCDTLFGASKYNGSLCPVGPFIADPGAAQRLTRSEKEQIVVLNTAGEKVCGWTAPA